MGRQGEVMACRAPNVPPVDYDILARTLRALAYPARLELLELLRYPKSVPEVRLSARRGISDGERPPPAARQTVAAHLTNLVDAGFVEKTRDTYGGRATVRYQTNNTRLFDTLEDLRRLSVRTHGAFVDEDSTRTLTAEPEAATATGPRFVIARGIEEGRVYALTTVSRGDAGWIIGRRPGHAVRMDFDGYVSTENSVIEKTAPARYTIRDLDSKNGTTVNWAALQPGESRTLSPGDIVGVGRSLLVFASK